MTRLTLDEERAMLAELAEGQSAPRFVALEEWTEAAHDALGVAWADQHLAATAEAQQQVQAVAGKGPYTHHTEVASRGEIRELGVMLFAAVLRCLAASRCEHAAAGDRPLVAFPAARVIACDRCVLRFRGALAAQDQRTRAGLDLLCDFCLSEHDWFHPVVVAFGPAKVAGDMCADCFGRFPDRRGVAE